MTDIYDASNNHTQFSWINGHIYRTTFPSGYYEGYTWDGTNQYLTSKTDRIGNAVYYSYDPQNRLYQCAGSYTATYDPAGRMTKVADSSTNSTWSFAYDNMNRLTQTTTKYGFLSSRNTFTVGYGYDAASNRTSLTDPENGFTQYTYDTLNRLTNLQDFQSHNFGFSYDQLSRRTQLTRPNGVNTNYSYDNLSRLLSVLHQMGSTTLDGASYTYDAAGNRTSKTDYLASVTTNYAYDAIYQLLQATQGTTTTESYTYDAVGNRLSSLGMSPYQYNSSNELTSTPTTTYTYDKDGELTTKVDSTGTTTYNWNTLNQLTSVVLPGSGGTVSFKYDPFGRRIQKSTASATTNYLYDGANLVEEVDNGGNALARYTQGTGLDHPLAMLRSGTTSYYNADDLGSITSLSSSVGALAETYTYDSFGKLTASTGAISNPFQYTARHFDTETGLYFYRARFYDSSSGRFSSEDPLRWRAGQTDFYAYVRNAPTKYVDPFGLQIVVQGDQADYQLAIGYLNHDPGMAAIIHDLDASSTIYTIIYNNQDDDTYDPSTHTIHWDPHSALRCSRGGTQSPALGLGHEMAHADQPWYWALIGWIPWPSYDNLEERRVIVGPETTAAQGLGEGTRTDHAGTPYPVATPTSR